jgi:P27 family predicted phage terminase small subunit
VVTVGKRGPAPAPTALKLIRGDRESRINREEPLPAELEAEAPDWLPGPAREVWDRLAPDLIAKGVLTPWDVDAFADLCNVIVINREALLDIDKNGTNCTTVDRELSDGTIIYTLTKNPSWQIAKESTVLITTLGGRFGLNPSDRSQLKVKGEEDGGKGAERLLS